MSETPALRLVPETPESWVTRDELAKIMGVSVDTIDNWRKQGMPSETWGLRVRRFLPSQAMQWVRTRKRAA